MPDPIDSACTLITDVDAVNAALADLRDQAGPSLLRGTADGRGHSVILMKIELAPPRLLWRTVDAGQTRLVAAGDMLQLEARRRAGHLVSSAMGCDRVSRIAHAGGRFEFRTRLPMQLALHHARHDWRARVALNEMPVEARLTRSGATPVIGLLLDLSVGGCGVVFDAGTAPIEPSEPIDLQLIFPNGEVAAFPARASSTAVLVNGQRRTGLIFSDVSETQARHLWFLTCEIDREIERRRGGRGELRPLAPSALFQRGT